MSPAADNPDKWLESAACRPGPINIFIDDTDPEKVARAKAICATCIVKAECLADALANPKLSQGQVRGNLTSAERAIINLS